MNTLQEEAEKEYPLEGEDLCYVDLGLIQQAAFIAGATSNAAKEYWKKQLEKEKLEFAIESLYILRCSPASEIDKKIEELQQKLNEINQ